MPRARTALGYATSVFTNCPFDADYESLLRAIVFAVIHCGYTVLCALEAEDTGATRIDRLIEECRFGIHDISPSEHDAVNNLPRFDMPFELGLFLGSCRDGSRLQRDKHCLVLEAERYRYQKYLSDIAGQDSRSHDNDPTRAVAAMRDWLASSRREPARPLPGARASMRSYNQFEASLPAMLLSADLEPAEPGFFDRANLMAQFLQTRASLLG
jgi:hypothetical protein